MRFEPGKYYKHSGGRTIATLDFLETTMYGKVLIVEQAGNRGHRLTCVGTDSDDYAINWKEITKEEWIKNFGEK